MTCPFCSTEIPDDDLFCENCGARLPVAAVQEAGACPCGAAAPGEVDEDGYCLLCGRRVRRSASDHMEQALSASFAAVSDRGLTHERNEDRFALVQHENGCALVVCDGVSTTESAEVAAAAAAETIAAVLRERMDAGPLHDSRETVRRAITVAAEAFRFVAERRDASEAAASTTAVVALVAEGQITLGWVGDSRAYWAEDSGAHALTRDHSWRAAVLESGEMTEEEVERDPQAHAITRWLGPDAGPASLPEVASHTLPGPGSLLLCTDGLWNYAAGEEAMGALLQRTGGGNALEAAQALVAFAKQQGGRDNVTVALLRVGPQTADGI